MERVVGEQALSVLVNGEPQSVPTGATVEVLLGLLGVRERRLAVAVNRSVVPRSRYDHVALAAGDRIEILEAVGGG
jgi:sulfur carrier protein